MAASACLGAFVGCDTTYAPRQTIDLRPRVLEVVNHHGGTRRVTLVHEDVWYQSFGPEIEIIDAGDGLRISAIESAPWGEIPPISDMVIAGDELVVVHARDRVVRYTLENPRRPIPVAETAADVLGIEPLFLSLVDGAVWVSGRGGAVALDAPNVKALEDPPGEDLVGRLVSSDGGLAASVGRRILAVDGGAYLGAATDLRPLPPEVATRIGVEGGFTYVFTGSRATTVGIMGGDLRVRDKEVFPTTIHSVRVLGDRLWAVMPTELVTWPIEDGGRLGQPQFIPVKGARDVGMLRDNYFAVAGTFGRAIYRFKADSTGDADEFLAVQRSPGRIERAITDGRRVLAGGVEGNWLYRIGGSIELSDRPLRSTTDQVDSVTLAWGQAGIDEDGRVLTIEALGLPPFQWSPTGTGTIYTLETAADHVWVGHDHGLVVFGLRDDAVTETGRIVMEGPVAWLFRPRVGDEVAFVSVFGGLGTAEVVPDPDADPNLVRQVRPEEVEDAAAEMRDAAGRPAPERR